MAGTFTRDELFDIEYALKNLIDDKNDYCANEEGTAETVARLEDLQAKVQGMLRESGGGCGACGAEVATVIGCPDGAEVCRQCFDSGAH